MTQPEITNYSSNSTWLVTSRHVSTWHGAFDVYSPCILAVPSLSNSTVLHARLCALDTSNVSCHVDTWRDEASGIWDYSRNIRWHRGDKYSTV